MGNANISNNDFAQIYLNKVLFGGREQDGSVTYFVHFVHGKWNVILHLRISLATSARCMHAILCV